MPREIRLKRAYEKASRDDGLRVLVDRLWPRGLSRMELGADLWLKDVAPSPALRRWFGHDARRWKVFRRRYRAELARRPQALRVQKYPRGRGGVTLLFPARRSAQQRRRAAR